MGELLKVKEHLYLLCLLFSSSESEDSSDSYASCTMPNAGVLLVLPFPGDPKMLAKLSSFCFPFPLSLSLSSFATLAESLSLFWSLFVSLFVSLSSLSSVITT